MEFLAFKVAFMKGATYAGFVPSDDVLQSKYEYCLAKNPAMSARYVFVAGRNWGHEKYSSQQAALRMEVAVARKALNAEVKAIHAARISEQAKKEFYEILPLLSLVSLRNVGYVRLTLIEGMDDAEVRVRYGISRDSLYQARKRGIEAILPKAGPELREHLTRKRRFRNRLAA